MLEPSVLAPRVTIILVQASLPAGKNSAIKQAAIPENIEIRLILYIMIKCLILRVKYAKL